MTNARCPLVREIDPKFRSGNAVPVERASITAEEWNRIRAALEAAEEMRELLWEARPPQSASPEMWLSLRTLADNRYRAATGGKE